ncbi:TetR/AcrR family transcriptional regulator [Acrocarpospora macrocephala]|uniref:TetR family transcriptional regulator n=1 Tax=Acrocarpospora macrocephala TaxID=150177 RepID=A0A5M3WZQ9_9ACTN|nr:TetR/AcrR family transcriptional regulator [Acrocarpospora macrocephala]GES11538.1 TetR family transcriptional regulator [Acrocarpospora macrocephala]
MAKSGIGKRRMAALRDGGEGYAQRRNEIIAAGAEVFRERGYEASSLRDVAARLGTDRASLYYYVASKNELFQLVTQQAVEQVVSAAESVAAEPADAVTRLRKLIVTTVQKYDEHYPYMFVYIQEDMNRIHSESLDEVWARTMLQLGRRFENALLTILNQGVADGVFDITHKHIAMNSIIGSINWTHRWFKPSGQLSGEQLGAHLSSMIISGLAK